MVYLRHNTSGATVATDPDPPGYTISDAPDAWTVVEVEPPPGVAADRLNLVDGELVEMPRRLGYDEVIALYTPAETQRIFSAPQLQVTQLLIALRYFGVVVGSIEHSQGTALIAGLGLLDGPDRVARILAGEPPLQESPI